MINALNMLTFIFPLFTLFLLCPRETESCDLSDKVTTNLWKVTTDPPSYFFGTVHVPFLKVWNGISGAAKEAFLSSEQFYVELDLSNPITLNQVIHCQLLPANTNVSEILSPELYQRLQDQLEWIKSKMPSWLTQQQEDFGLNFSSLSANWQRKRPVWLRKIANNNVCKKNVFERNFENHFLFDASLLTVASLLLSQMTESEVSNMGVSVLDTYLAQVAKNLHKVVEAVETAEEQCGAFNSLSDSLAISLLNGTLNYQERERTEAHLPQIYEKEDLISDYLCGYSRTPTFQEQLGGFQLSSETIAQIGKDRGKWVIILKCSFQRVGSLTTSSSSETK